eukprot:scaffold2558_cov279-Alexandrium_tamarense.AAC.6
MEQGLPSWPMQQRNPVTQHRGRIASPGRAASTSRSQKVDGQFLNLEATFINESELTLLSYH